MKVANWHKGEALILNFIRRGELCRSSQAALLGSSKKGNLMLFDWNKVSHYFHSEDDKL